VVATPPPAQYFASAADFRRWLETHHDAHRELVVGFHSMIDQILTHLRTRASRAAYATGMNLVGRRPSRSMTALAKPSVPASTSNTFS
jgi:hypothetical protein